MDRAEFRQWLSEVVQQRGLSASATARLAGVTPKTISEWRAGRGPLHPDHVRAQIEARLSGKVYAAELPDRGAVREGTAVKYTTDLPYLAQIQRRIERLFHRTRGQEGEWIILERLLDFVEPPQGREVVQRERYWEVLRGGGHNKS